VCLAQKEAYNTDMERKINYKGIFWAGFVFLAAGVPLSIVLGPVGIAILGTGIGLMAIGLSQRDKWNQD
jgi:hypothetical protein